jgi:hypothetical protein
MIHEPHYWTDPAAKLDSEVNLICEKLGVGPALARRIKEYGEDRVLEYKLLELENPEVHQIVALVVGELTRPCKNIRARIWGLIFATGLGWASTEAEIARQLGCTRALINHYKMEWLEKMRSRKSHFLNYLQNQ